MREAKVAGGKASRKLEEMETEHQRFVARLLDMLERKYGRSLERAVANDACRRAQREWTEKARNRDSNTLEELVDLIWNEQTRSRGYRFSVEKTPERITVTVTRCPIHQRAEKAGSTRWTYHLVCAADSAIVRGFNPKLGFRHAKILTRGDAVCEQHYYVKRRKHTPRKL